MENIKITKEYLILDKRELITNNIDEVKNLLNIQKTEIEEWKWDSEDYPFSIIIERIDNPWNKINIYGLPDWFLIELYSNIWVIKKMFFFFERKLNKFSRNYTKVEDVIDEVKLFSSYREEDFINHFNSFS